jgi:A/G-specific adenine glycosylase
MEFGALQCIPVSPDCAICPFEANCLAYAGRSVARYPVKQNKTKTKDLYLYYFHIHDADHLYIKERNVKGIWQNLFEFPLIESDVPLDFEQLSRTPQFKEWFREEYACVFKRIIEKRKHVLSHRVLYADFYEVYIEKGLKILPEFTKIKKEELNKYPVHRLMQYYLEEKFDI